MPWRRPLVVTAVVCAPLLVAGVLAVFGVVNDFQWQLMYFLLVLIGAPTAGFCLLSLPLPSARRAGPGVIVTLSMLLFAMPLSAWLSYHLRHVGFRFAAERMQPVASAVELYVGSHGHLPARVENLVPHYLAALPERVPKMELYDSHPGQPWVLLASYHDGLCDGYDVIYLPNGSAGERRSAEPLGGNWFCVRF